MTPFTRLRTTAAPLIDQGKLMVNVDTDMIIPKQFLKTTERIGLSEGLFYELKTLPNGDPNPEFILNRSQFKTAGVLIAGENFGCGSSREHAPWALLDQGIRCVIAPSFADIFYNNCAKNGILAITLPLEMCEALADQAGGANSIFEVDLEASCITGPTGEVIAFDYDSGRREKLLKGLDDIALTLQVEAEISAFEATRRKQFAWLEGQP